MNEAFTFVRPATAAEEDRFVADVVAAYRATGLKPEPHNYYSIRTHSQKECACALGAYAIARGVPKNGDQIAKAVFDDVDEAGKEWWVGFTKGFDGYGPPTTGWPERAAGHRLGVRCWEAVKKAGLS